ncbi:sugar phosphate isomerase/epimerase [Acidipila sp. EB88]|uniref:sugar phosphate isomerase/epimerase family protein n=1 Tax=Acidipila sp. EB88 TaxID=2305226 RepID=UPI000F603BFE|nr:sugar phosphate isomerase/epimerase [Acidipila sp. EB88]RRA48499.1 sugar phosphate isomerase/epimerase [Acidipila sp. EB88]
MPSITRRRFVQSAATAAAAATLLPGRTAHANPFNLPLGLQLYSVREQLQRDYSGTLKQLHDIGFREVEAAGFFKQSPEDVQAAMAAAGLRCVSAHYPYAELDKGLDAILDFHRKLGTAHFILCSFPGFRPGASAATLPYGQQVKSFTLDDWRWNAERFNTWGKRIHDAGFQFGYHNHTMEFAPQKDAASGASIIPFDLLLQHTDPALVAIELDCGWVTVGGGSPEHYLRTFPDRIKMLHVKDFASAPGHTSADNPPPAAELGRGTSNYPAIFAAAKHGAIQHLFIEQEDYPDLPWAEALRTDARYLHSLKP